VDVKRVLHIVRSPEAAAVPATAVAEHDVLVYTYVPAQPPARAWLLWRDPAAADASGPTPQHVQAIDTATLCRLAFELDAVAVW
jgi:hypothetical protein